jgi:hypothetical protein
MPNARVTVTLPEAIVDEIDREEKNRSRFVLQAVNRELARRRREQLRRSLRKPHPETLALAEQGLDEWAGHLPAEEISDLVAPGAGKPIRWTSGRGWTGPGE